MTNKVKVALDRIAKAAKLNNNQIFMGHSGGKDSTVIYDLTKKVLGKDFRVVHNIKPMLGTSGNKVGALTEMHSETLQFLYTKVCPTHPVLFLHSSEMERLLKIYDTKCQIDGSRLCEYTREGKSSEFIKNGKSVSRSEMTEYIENGIFGLNMCYPIFDWSDYEVFEYIDKNNLIISEEYFIPSHAGNGHSIKSEWQLYCEGRSDHECN